MADKTIFGCAETGTYQTSAPNPHIDLSGTASTSYSIAQLFADAMSSDETATVSIIKDKDNWAVYGGAKFSNDTVDTLDLSVATILESKGTLSDEDAVTCLGLAPGNRGMHAARVYLNTASNSPNAASAKLPIDTVDYDTGGIWDAGQARFEPKLPGYYLIIGRGRTNTVTSIAVYVAKNGSEIGLGGGNADSTLSAGGSAIVYCNGTTDYIELYGYTTAVKSYTTGTGSCWLAVLGPLAV